MMRAWLGNLATWAVRWPLLGPRVMGWFLRGVVVGFLIAIPSCTQDGVVESDRVLGKQGDVDAQARLGVAYYNGRGVAQDHEEAVRWARLAAEQGNARAQALLGVAYFNGHGVTQDHEEAARWSRLAAEQGNSGAQALLGVAYSNGAGVAQDHVSAYMWLTLAGTDSSVSGAREIRDHLATRMTPEEIAEAQRRARDWAK